jgi:hypothetical protein
VASTYIDPCIIDVVFLGDRLYAITQAEDLMPLNLALDGDGKPIRDEARKKDGRGQHEQVEKNVSNCLSMY